MRSYLKVELKFISVGAKLFAVNVHYHFGNFTTAFLYRGTIHKRKYLCFINHVMTENISPISASSNSASFVLSSDWYVYRDCVHTSISRCLPSLCKCVLKIPRLVFLLAAIPLHRRHHQNYAYVSATCAEVQPKECFSLPPPVCFYTCRFYKLVGNNLRAYTKPLHWFAHIQSTNFFIFMASLQQHAATRKIIIGLNVANTGSQYPG